MDFEHNEFPRINPSLQCNYIREAHTNHLDKLLESNNLCRMSAVPINIFQAVQRSCGIRGNLSGNDLWNKCVSALRVNEQYRYMYYRIAGSECDFDKQLHDLDHFDKLDEKMHNLMLFVISDEINRPLLIWSSYVHSVPMLFIGENLRRSKNACANFVQIAFNASTGKYHNIKRIKEIKRKSVKQQSISKNEDTKPSKRRKLNPNNGDKPNYMNGREYFQSQNIPIRNKYDNEIFLWLIYLCLIHHYTKDTRTFGSVLDKNAPNSLSAIIHYIFTKATERINKPLSGFKKKALHQARNRTTKYFKLLHYYSKQLEHETKIYLQSECNGGIKTRMGLITCSQCGNKLLNASNHAEFVICHACKQFYSKHD